MICLFESNDNSEEEQLQRLQHAHEISPPSEKREMRNLPPCLDTPKSSSKTKRIKEISTNMVYYIISISMKRNNLVSFVFSIRPAWATTI